MYGTQVQVFDLASYIWCLGRQDSDETMPIMCVIFDLLFNKKWFVIN